MENTYSNFKLPSHVKLSNGEYIEVQTINDEATVNHRDGRNTVVKVAAISDNYREGEASILTPRKFVAFEVQEGQIIDKVFIDKMMQQYLL